MINTLKIGLETHLPLKTNSKLFCSCSTRVDARPNTQVCEVCLGLPGSKPTLNVAAVNAAIKLGLALNCKINSPTFFSRKTYFYPDMSKNFQITQYEIPIAEGGFLMVGGKKIKIRRVHIEEDPAKIIHKDNYALVDYNRSGAPLLEIVTDPDITSPREARLYLQKLSLIAEYLQIFDSSDEASMKSDVNVSTGGDRAEVKNVSGFKDAEKAISFEQIRQKNVVLTGSKVIQETRMYNPTTGSTTAARTKETESGYGYI
ncbi:MAG: Asp-tRNA(Asn)/Glu-tRNA(Gln) amidotransferase GatCAB subunit B, partial [Euryarchaeota archaeon HGW-Euryarchaeota-1]